ncbi:MAG: proprotein convertase P-domain-containing protein [Verrucomicrobiota bacterium]
MNPPFRTGILVSLSILSATRGSADYYIQRAHVDSSTGYLESYVDRDWYRGSGVVARDSRLIYSCGHLFYENGVWATDYEFYRNYSNYYPPEPGTGSKPRGFHYFTNYSDNVNFYGGDSSRAFAYDFTVFYGPDSFGPAAGHWADGGAVLRSSREKRIVGYPATIEHTGARGYSYQYATDWFPLRAYQIRAAYHGFDDVSTGEGTSGGPVFVRDTTSDDYSLAGILVSGSYNTAGVYALNSSSNAMASAALGLQSVTQTFSNTSAFQLPDADSGFSTRKTTASGFADTVTGLKFSLSMTTPRRGDLDVYLRSPSGRIRWVNKASSNTADNLVVNEANYSSTFRGYAANGVWQVKMRDSRVRNRAAFHQFSVSVTAYAE